MTLLSQLREKAPEVSMTPAAKQIAMVSSLLGSFRVEVFDPKRNAKKYVAVTMAKRTPPKT
jgi:hypothetical protein